MKKNPNPVQLKDHYHQDDLLEKIKQTLHMHNRSLDSLERSDLAAFDELHVGGREASRRLAEKSGILPCSLLLDVGSGIGGPARMLADDFKLTVVGLDLTEAFCRVAHTLSTAVNSKGTIGFINGNALHLPFRNECFDGIWSQHCAMNIQDKKALYAEFFRVTRKQGKLLIHDVVAGNNQPVLFPVPWASGQQFSFLNTEPEQKRLLQDAGFKQVIWQEITEQALSWYDTLKRPAEKAKPALLNQKLVFGESLREMAGNMKRNLTEKRIKIVEAVWEK